MRIKDSYGDANEGGAECLDSLFIVKTRMLMRMREEQSCYGAQPSAYKYNNGAPCLGLKKTCRLHANRINDLLIHITGNGWSVEELDDWFEDNI